MPRTLPRSLAAVVEDLEVDQPRVVTMATLRTLVERHGLGTTPPVVAARLRKNGWLLATGTRGVWEFAPGAHAGPYSHRDPTLALRAALAASPKLPAALALGSAAWALGFADRAPATLDVALPDLSAATAALARDTHLSSFTSRLGYATAQGVPTHRPETVLAHLATSPTIVRSWSAVLEWLPDLAADLDVTLTTRELAGRPTAVRVRVGYLMSGLRPDIAALTRPDVAAPVRFGKRSAATLRHSSDWRVLDSLLPIDPSRLDEVEPEPAAGSSADQLPARVRRTRGSAR